MEQKLSEDTFINQFCSKNIPSFRKIRYDVNIGIAGCGGLGSNIAVILVRSGIGKLTIADYDKVEASNLNRQNYFIQDISKNKVDVLKKRLHEINPFEKIQSHNIKINNVNLFEIFQECDIVVEAFDKVEDKSMIVNEFSKLENEKKYLVAASGLAGIGNSEEIKTKQLSKNIFVCGDFISSPEFEEGIMAPKVMITAGFQANLVLNLISKLKG